MKYTTLGGTSLKISRIGFGCWAMGGHGYGPVEFSDSEKAVHKALELGVNFFDTADVYGFGKSEELLAKALGSKRKDVVIATKFGVAWDETGKTYKDCSPKHMVSALEASLKRLKLECIPLYQIHWYDGKTSLQEIMSALRKCQKQGKILHIGCSNFSSEMIGEANAYEKVQALQSDHNILNPLATDFLKKLEENQISLIAYNLLARGLLTGKYRQAFQFSEGDTRSQDPNFTGEQFQRNLKVIEALEKVEKKVSFTKGQIAIGLALHNPQIACGIIGFKTEKQVEENLHSLSWTPDLEAVKLVEQAVKERYELKS
jgi:aryl-alcohol dehydrogenase-like predicted oxidoreductase